MANNRSVVIDYDKINYKEELNEHIHNIPRYTREYVHDLFPIAQWIHKYNLTVSMHLLIKRFTLTVALTQPAFVYLKKKKN